MAGITWKEVQRLLDMNTPERMRFLSASDFQHYRGSVDEGWECYQKKQLIDGTEYVLFPSSGAVNQSADWSGASNIGSELQQRVIELGRSHKPLQFEFFNRYSALNLFHNLEGVGFKRSSEFKHEVTNREAEGGTIVLDCVLLKYLSYFAVFCERKAEKPLYQILVAKREDLSAEEQILELEKEASPVRIDLAATVQARPSTGGPVVLIVLGGLIALSGIGTTSLAAIVVGSLLLVVGLFARSSRLGSYRRTQENSRKLADRLKELESRILELRAKQKA